MQFEKILQYDPRLSRKEREPTAQQKALGSPCNPGSWTTLSKARCSQDRRGSTLTGYCSGALCYVNWFTSIQNPSLPACRFAAGAGLKLTRIPPSLCYYWLRVGLARTFGARSMEELLKKAAEHFGYAAPFLYAGVTYKVFSWIDKEISEQAKMALASTMSLTTIKNKGVAAALVEVFDRIYSDPLLSWRALARSSLFTLVIAALFIFEIRNTALLQDLEKNANGFVIARAFAATFIVNALSDYLALFVIRPWLRAAGNRPLLALLTAMFLAVLVVLIGMIIRAFVIVYLFPETPRPPQPVKLDPESMEWVIWSISGLLRFAVVSVLPAAAVFIWLPLFAIGILLVRLLKPLSWLVSNVQWMLHEGEKHPLKAVGCVAAVSVFIASVGLQLSFGM